jgi:hypothetical protein
MTCPASTASVMPSQRCASGCVHGAARVELVGHGLQRRLVRGHHVHAGERVPVVADAASGRVGRSGHQPVALVGAGVGGVAGLADPVVEPIVPGTHPLPTLVYPATVGKWQRKRATAHAIPCFEQQHGATGGLEGERGGKTGEARPDHHDIDRWRGALRGVGETGGGAPGSADEAAGGHGAADLQEAPSRDVGGGGRGGHVRRGVGDTRGRTAARARDQEHHLVEVASRRPPRPVTIA